MTDHTEHENKNFPVVDGFSDFEDGTEGEEGQSSDRVIQGTRLKFGNDFQWKTGDKEVVPKDQEFVIVDTRRCLQKWVDSVPTVTEWIEPNRKWPNVAERNKECPEEEWGLDFNGEPQGPWRRQRITYLVDPNTMAKYTWADNHTVGGDMCIREFRDKIANMRRFRGQNVYAVVTLSDTYMPTNYGGRQRPVLKIVRWIALLPSGSALPSPQTPEQVSVEQASAEQTKAVLSKLQDVKPPSPGEEMGDNIPF